MNFTFWKGGEITGYWLYVYIYMYILMHKRQSAPFQESLPNLKKTEKIIEISRIP